MIKAFKLGLAGGIVWGLSIFLCTILAMFTGYSTALLKIMMSLYPGYELSWSGAFLGLVYGFFDAFIGLGLIGLIYNLISRCGCRCGCSCKSKEQKK